ncbi:bifunctional proline dehydrogenase/L-glutamate gamma-semialdehyde dehydrogenase PutA [Novosphingobium profundi]|uniref:bifunctional proline dehydrogenase/L-glutamate gamma-semialdehyde dehydrogenase PutA n=1 Tax=Novosphingobium profundi TaxID=1774954 RepID=UPI001BDA2760|nr:bifunctional proline dehydrogenase/L-glutamate gamma-semialdehyde dehydrogenase PutA [Novosphingobium profundi]MBT0667138.1 bifunctional proline dehydrogenase/L-glutamate gamma-semialdehyde dehydrogenase PutA [Novosphingobium profundi]
MIVTKTTHTPFAAFAPPVREPSALRQSVTAAYRRSEPEAMAPLIAQARFPGELRDAIRKTATDLVEMLRVKQKASAKLGGVDALMQEYSLSSLEGVALMCLAEALLRIPDDDTRDALIRDKIGKGQWREHMGGDRSLFVNAATWGLVVAGKLYGGIDGSVDDQGLATALNRLIGRAGEPVVRRGVDIAMRMMGEQFVTGQTIAKALKRARELEAKGFRYSYDMLGEAAVTAADADRYYKDYEKAIHAIGVAGKGKGVYEGPGISIKLSALHPRYARAKAGRVMGELLPRVKALAVMAKTHDIGFNIDAEEADRLELSLDLLESLALDPDLAGWNGLGFVVQAYGKRCPQVIDWLIDLGQRANRRIMVRLVKGAYWDAEIKRSQVEGLADFPVFTRKRHTDVSYIACARKLLGAPKSVYPQFATHNAQTLATIYHYAKPESFTVEQYEFQCLHGMGEALYSHVVAKDKLARPCRIYAPVGTHETLLAYLVRRLLENGANSSFVNRIADPKVPVSELVEDPVEAVLEEVVPGAKHDKIDFPAKIYPDRANSAGLDLSDDAALAALTDHLLATLEGNWHAEAEGAEGERADVVNPADHGDVVGSVIETPAEYAQTAMARACASAWGSVAVAERAAILERAADAMQAAMPALMGLAMREAGKSAANAIAEVREAIDFLHYYALQARQTFGAAQGPLGPIVCISPWNFPLAIFTGQVSAALVAGNPVLAKPAEETPLIAAEAVRILHEAGVPADALQLLPGDGKIGAALIERPEVAGVMFTGSTEVARLIQKQLSTRLHSDGMPIPFIAETGGQNAMIVDSTALPEQVVADVIVSAFDSAGQRCSALRILCLQDEIASHTLEMLKGALAELEVGNPDRLSVDVGPVITAEAQERIVKHIDEMRGRGHKVHQVPLGEGCEKGTFVAPTIIEIDAIEDVEQEVFGPVLHVLRYKRKHLEALIDGINATGYGLTFGLHTRMDGTVAHVLSRVRAGNRYVNRNQVGAIVGVQPFGGNGLSGTGPKAGGPLYLGRLASHAPLVLAPSGVRLPLVDEFVAWLAKKEWFEGAAQARAIHTASRLGSHVELPGPVGERNEYSLHPRGRLLLRPKSRAGLIRLMAMVLATGNTATVEGMDLPQGLPDGVASAFRPDPDEPYAACLVEGGEEALLKALADMAERPGPIVPVRSAGRPGPGLAWLLEEVSVSINTTAAGGNASLMMIG